MVYTYSHDWAHDSTQLLSTNVAILNHFFGSVNRLDRLWRKKPVRLSGVSNPLRGVQKHSADRGSMETGRHTPNRQRPITAFHRE